MDIILDTNIFISNITLDTENFNLLYDYLEKTKSKIILPEIVYKEIKSVYRRKLKDKYNNYLKEKNSMKKYLLEDDITEEYNFNIEDKVEHYIKFLKNKLDIEEKEIIPYKAGYLDEVVYRAINKKKPCTKKGEEFRDTLLWLTIIDIAKTKNDKEIIFISENTSDFALKGELHPDLIEEANKEGVKINYFNSLKQFIKYHASQISYITPEWIKSSMDIENLNKQVLKILEENAEDKFRKMIELKEEENQYSWYNLTNYINFVSLFLNNVDDFFVYERSDETLYLEVNLEGELEIEYEIEYEENVEKLVKDYEYKVDPISGDLEPVYVDKLESDSELKIEARLFYRIIQIDIGVNIEDNNINSYTIKDWEVV